MGIEYKRLSEKELDVFIEMRVNQERWYICVVDCCR